MQPRVFMLLSSQNERWVLVACTKNARSSLTARLACHEARATVQKVPQGAFINFAEAHQHRRVSEVVIGEVVRIRSIFEQCLTPIKINANCQSVWLNILL